MRDILSGPRSSLPSVYRGLRIDIKVLRTPFWTATESAANSQVSTSSIKAVDCVCAGLTDGQELGEASIDSTVVV
jgi:hypothetical protein